MKLRTQLPLGLAGAGEAHAPRSEEAVHILVYRIDKQGYGLFLSDVERVVRAVAVTPLQDAPDTILGIIDLQGRVVPVVNLRRKLGAPERRVGLSDHFVIARTHRRTVALVVDSAAGVIARPKAEVVASGSVVPGLENLKGIIKLDDALILVHDLDRFLFSEEEQGLDDVLAKR